VCTVDSHRALKASPSRLAAECTFLGVQRDEGYDDLYMVNCGACKSTLGVRRAVWMLALVVGVGMMVRR
jgi:hypothetical protein